MYRGSVRTIVVRNVDLAASIGNGVPIAIPSRNGSPLYEVVGLRITCVSGTTFSAPGCTFNVTTDTSGNYSVNGGNGNSLFGFNVPLNMNGSTPGETRSYTPVTSSSGGVGGGCLILGAGWLQSSPILFFRCTAFISFCTLVVDIQLDIRDVGRVTAPTVTDNTLAKIRCANSLNVQVSKILRANNSLYILAPNWVTREGVTKNNVVVYDLATGLAAPFNFTSAGGSVLDFAVDASNGDVYVVGTFTSINGTARNRAACVDSTGTLKAWDPNVSGDRIGTGAPQVNRIRMIGSALYFAGNFTTVLATTRNMAAAVDTAGALTAFNPNLNGSSLGGVVIGAVVAYGTDVLLGGNIITVGGIARLSLASVTQASGALNAWAPSVGAPLSGTSIADIVTDGTDMWVSGGMTTVPARPTLAKFDAVGNVVVAFNAPAGVGSGATLFLTGNHLFVSSLSQPTPLAGIVDKTTGANTSAQFFSPGLRTGGIYADPTDEFFMVGNLATASCVSLLRYQP